MYTRSFFSPCKSLATGMLLLAVVTSLQAAAQEPGTIVHYNGNIFEYGARLHKEVAPMIDIATGDVGSVHWNRAIPVKMNGKVIYRTTDLLQQPELIQGNLSIADHVHKELLQALDNLPDGTYSWDIENIVVDTSGKVVFYDGTGIRVDYRRTNPDGEMIVIPKDKEEAIMHALNEILKATPALLPGRVNDKPVIVLTENTFYAYSIIVKDHKATATKIYK